MEKFGSFENGIHKENREKKKTRFETIRKYALVGLGAVVVGHSEAQVLEAYDGTYENTTTAYTEHYDVPRSQPLTVDYVLALNPTDESKKWSPEVHDRVDMLLEKVGISHVTRIMRYDALANIPGLKTPTSTDVAGFDGGDYISDDDIKAIVNPELFPQDWLTYIQKVSFEKDENVGENVNASLVQADDFNRRIVVYNIDRAEGIPEEYRHQENVALLGETIRHEVCHANDWATLREVSFADRVALLQDVVAHMMNTLQEYVRRIYQIQMNYKKSILKIIGWCQNGYKSTTHSFSHRWLFLQRISTIKIPLKKRSFFRGIFSISP